MREARRANGKDLNQRQAVQNAADGSASEGLGRRAPPLCGIFLSSDRLATKRFTFACSSSSCFSRRSADGPSPLAPVEGCRYARAAATTKWSRTKASNVANRQGPAPSPSPRNAASHAAPCHRIAPIAAVLMALARVQVL